MSQKSLAKKVVWTRRIVQVLSLGLFFWLFWAVRVHEGAPVSPAKSLVNDDFAWLRVFFDLDPLVAAVTWLSSHELRTTPVLALATVIVTVLLGRVFCGWICPLGVIHNAATWFRARMRWNVRAPRDNWSPWQRAKYYVLAGLLVMALFGAHWAGVFDPIPLLFRSTATVLYPGTQYVVEDAATAGYNSDPHVGSVHLKSATEPVYRFMRDNVFKAKRQTFWGTDLIFLLFLGIVLLNLYRSRFWCRYVCPLGGLLGVCAQRPVLRIENREGCTDCGLCAMKCPAAANPDKPGDWRSAECFGCWNCVA
ncbi:MAG: 4Fe-4S binding protein, partial [Candidatus Hydrogenedentes bacterium]|nr:4Fe-4S binding protein [Candidatus Hydrogenedentota bacterium]